MEVRRALEGHVWATLSTGWGPPVHVHTCTLRHASPNLFLVIGSKWGLWCLQAGCACRQLVCLLASGPSTLYDRRAARNWGSTAGVGHPQLWPRLKIRGGAAPGVCSS
eukprot:361952-Chlamydomonas_euryale.AAC.4